MPVIEPDLSLYNNSRSDEAEQQVVEKNSLISAFSGIKWQGYDCQFTDWKYLPNINLWRDFLPPEFESKLPGLTAGDEISHYYPTGELLDNFQSSLQYTVSHSQFQPPQITLNPVSPLYGRYYPKDFFSNIEGVYEGNKFPCKIIALDDKTISVDLNHPLAGKDIEMIMRIDSIKIAGAERGGRCNDIAAIITEKGPGMQDRPAQQEVDFFSNNPFQRLNEDSDEDFFKLPDYSPFWDSVALAQVTRLYEELIPPDAQILDLMAGAHSPLIDANIQIKQLSCAGLNEDEMAFNKICNQSFKVDVNNLSSLPFQDTQFDIVLIHAAIEYVINPDMLFSEIHRILKPSGRVIISFSNRSIEEKSIKLWNQAHEFERPAIVLAYLRSKNQFGNFHSYSMRGLLRPEDDKLAEKLLYSDPVYAIWGDKI